MTKSLQLLDAVARHLGISHHTTDQQLAELSQPTSVHAMLGALTAARDAGPRPDTPPAHDGTPLHANAQPAR